MKCKIKLCLTGSEISRARDYGIEVEVGTQEDTNYWRIVGICKSVYTALSFLRTIHDLQDTSDEDLEELYIGEM